MDQIDKDVCTGVEILKNILVAYQWIRFGCQIYMYNVISGHPILFAYI
jgi:hypothetical protein